MNNAKIDSTIRNKISGRRLTECMKLKKMKIAELSDWISTNKGMDSYSMQYISQMRTGHRAISSQNAFLFAECLGIDSGYLLGKDNFIAQSYEEYLSIIGSKEKWKEQLQSDRAELHKYDGYLHPCGYKVIEATFNPEGKPTEYRIAHNGNEAMISVSEMQKFKKAIDEQIQLRMKALMDKYKT